MFVQQIKRDGADGKATWRTEMHGGVAGCVFGKLCLSVDGAELPKHSGTRPFSLNLGCHCQLFLHHVERLSLKLNASFLSNLVGGFIF